MKKLLFLFASITLLSCSSNDNDSDNNSTSTNIVAKWNLTKILENGKEISGYTCNSSYDVTEYLDNGKAVIAYADKNNKNVCTQFFEEATYTLSNNVLTETQKNNSIVIYQAKYNVKELTNTSLKLETISTFEADNNGSNPYTEKYASGEEIKVFVKLN